MIEAVDLLTKNARVEDVPLLISAYRLQPDYLVRIDIIDLLGLTKAEASCAFLLEIATSRAHFLVRYYAFRNLIELKCPNWKLPPRRSPFYDSLREYQRYVKGEIGIEALRETAASRYTWNGDHWYWLTQWTVE